MPAKPRPDPWSRPLTAPLVLKDGRRIVTLADARAFMIGLAESTALRPYWQYAGELVLEAATRPRAGVKDAWAQLGRALRAENWL